MPVRRLWGVGEATRATLEAFGVATVGDLAAVPEELLRKRLGSSLAQHLSRLAAGIDPREVDGRGDAKSVSVEETFDEDLADHEEIQRALLRLCDRLASRLHRSGHAGSTVSLKVRFGDFETVSRSATVSDPVEHTPALWDESQALMERVGIGGRGVRLLGVAVTGLVGSAAPRQLSLDSQPRDAAAGVVEQVRERFGDGAVLPASLLAQDEQDEWGN
jgi:DNA polymerase-4